MLSSGKLTPSTIPHLHLNGAQSLQPFTAYGLPALCLRLTPTVTGTRSRLDNRYGGSPLPVLYFQLPANKCLVAHQSNMQINTAGFLVPTFICFHSQFRSYLPPDCAIWSFDAASAKYSQSVLLSAIVSAADRYLSVKAMPWNG